VWGEEWTAMKCHSTQAPLGRTGTLRKASGQAEDPARLCKGKKTTHVETFTSEQVGVHTLATTVILIHVNCGGMCPLKYLPLAYNSYMYT